MNSILWLVTNMFVMHPSKYLDILFSRISELLQAIFICFITALIMLLIEWGCMVRTGAGSILHHRKNILSFISHCWTLLCVLYTHPTNIFVTNSQNASLLTQNLFHEIVRDSHFTKYFVIEHKIYFTKTVFTEWFLTVTSQKWSRYRYQQWLLGQRIVVQ